MAYIGNQPFTTAFLTDQFSGTGSQTAFTLSAAPASTSSIIVAVTGVLQDPSTYSVVGTTLNFSAAPPSGTGNISVRFLGIPASGVTTTAYRTLTEFTATAGQTTFTPPSYTVGYISVFRNGVMLGTADYTASNGTTVVLVNPASAGDLVATESFYVSSVLNAIPGTAGSVGTTYLVNGSVTPAKLSTGGPSWDTSGNVGIGTSSPVSRLNVSVTDGGSVTISNTNDTHTGALNFGDTSSNTSGRISYDHSSNALRFDTNGTERARIDSSGNLLVGITSTADSHTFVGKTQNGWSFRLLSDFSTQAYGQLISYRNSAPNGTSNEFLYAIDTGGTRMTLRSNGGIANYSGNNVNLSDRREKTNFAPAGDWLPKICAIPVQTFNYTDQNMEEDPGLTLGVVAQDVQAVAPELVMESNWGTQDDPRMRLSIYQTDLQYALMKCIQELKTELDAAKARIAELENKA